MPGRPSNFAGVTAEGVPAHPPGIPDPGMGVEDDEIAVLLRQVVAEGEPGLAASDDHGVEHVVLCS